MITQVGFTQEGMPYNYAEYQCDFEEEINDLPGLDVCAASSKVYVLETGNIYRLSNSGIWNLAGNAKSDGDGGGSSEFGVASFKGRQGNVMPQKGDYSADKVLTSWAGKTVQDKLNELEDQQKFDTTLSSGSTRGVQNWVINQAVDELTAKSLPRGGGTGAILTKHSSADFDAEWTSASVYMKKSEYDRDANGKVDKADAADSVQGPGSYKARLKNTGADTYLVTDVDKGVANGVAPLDSTGKILPQYLPDSLMGGLTNGGIFNASTRVITLSDAAKAALQVTTDTMTLANTRTVPSGYPTDAELYYITTVDGVFAEMNFAKGDWLFSMGNQWQQLINGNQVASVQGKTGAVLLDSDDVPEGTANLYMTAAEKTKLRDIEAEATKDVDVVQSAIVVRPATGGKYLRLQNKNGTVTTFTADEIDETLYLRKTGDASDTTVSYGTAASRTAMPGNGTMRDTIALIRRYLSDLQTAAFTGSYADLVDEPTKLSQFTNDGNGDIGGPFITRDVNNLLNYYTKSDSYTKREIDTLLAALEGHNYIVVDQLPTRNIDAAAIYYVPIMDGTTQVGYDRYQRIGNQWAFLGSTDIDMNQYLKIDGDGTNITSAHTTPSSRLALTSGEKLSVSLGKIAKWLSDLKPVAFTGSFNDLIDTEQVVRKDDLDDYVTKDQGIANAGKIMGIGVDGKVAPVAVSEGATRRGSGAYAVIGNDDSETPINQAEGARSAAFGDHTIAKGASKFVAGKFNWIDNNNLYAEQIGGGDENTRLDLRNTDWSGKGYYRNGVSVGNTTDNIVEPENGNDLTTKTYVDRTIGEEIAKADLLRSMVVADVPTLALADNNTLYLVPDPTSENHYQQYKKVLKSQNPDVYEMANLGGTQLTLESNQVESFPQASATYAGKVYQYVGADSGNYRKGANYTCAVQPFYAWLRVGDAERIYFTEHVPVLAKEYVYRGSSGYVGSICALTASGTATTFTDGLGNSYTRLTAEDLSNYYQWVPLFTQLSDFTTEGVELTPVADNTKFSSVDLKENKINFILGSKIWTYIWSKIKGSKWTNAVNADNQGSDVIPSASAVYNSIGKRILVNQYSVPDAGQTVAQVLSSAGLNIAGGYACAYVRNTAKISNRPFIDGGAVYVEVIARDTTTRIVRWTNWVGERSMTCSQTNGTWSSWYETGGGTVTEGANDNAISYSTPTSQGYKITGNYSSAVPPRAFKTGKVVNLSFHCTGKATAIEAGWTTIGVVNSLYRPKYQVPIVAMVYDGNNGNQAAGGYINTGGSVVLWTNAKSSTTNYQVRVNVTYLTN